MKVLLSTAKSKNEPAAYLLSWNFHDSSQRALEMLFQTLLPFSKAGAYQSWQHLRTLCKRTSFPEK